MKKYCHLSFKSNTRFSYICICVPDRLPKICETAFFLYAGASLAILNLSGSLRPLACCLFASRGCSTQRLPFFAIADGLRIDNYSRYAILLATYNHPAKVSFTLKVSGACVWTWKTHSGILRRGSVNIRSGGQ